jgi:hypothetical protein
LKGVGAKKESHQEILKTQFCGQNNQKRNATEDPTPFSL